MIEATTAATSAYPERASSASIRDVGEAIDSSDHYRTDQLPVTRAVAFGTVFLLVASTSLFSSKRDRLRWRPRLASRDGHDILQCAIVGGHGRSDSQVNRCVFGTFQIVWLTEADHRLRPQNNMSPREADIGPASIEPKPIRVLEKGPVEKRTSSPLESVVTSNGSSGGPRQGPFLPCDALRWYPGRYRQRFAKLPSKADA